MIKPNFFIIGAPKCGTTAVARWLSQHSDVYFSPRKEPHFFNTDGITEIDTLQEYEALFADATDKHAAVGEGSTTYLYSCNAVSNILEYSPNAKFIVCLRNPIEMAPALHGERLAQGRESESDFERAWCLQPERIQGRHIPATVAAEPYRLFYGEQCKLGMHLNRLYSQVPRSKVHTILLDEIRIAPERVYSQVLDFLNLPDQQKSIDFSPVNTSKRTRSTTIARMLRYSVMLKKKLGISRSFGTARMLKGINVTRAPRIPLTIELKRELSDYFESDVRLLATLIDRDLTDWLRKP